MKRIIEALTDDEQIKTHVKGTKEDVETCTAALIVAMLQDNMIDMDDLDNIVDFAKKKYNEVEDNGEE